MPVWRQLATEYAGRGVVVVAHGVVCKVLLLSLIPGHSAADWSKLGPVRNVGISELVWTGSAWKAERLNDVPREVEEAGG